VIRIAAIGIGLILLAGCSSAGAPPAVVGSAGAVGGVFTVDAVVNDDQKLHIATVNGQGSDQGKFYPPRAAQTGQSGEAVVRCEAFNQCAMVSETAPLGFGAAALRNVDRIHTRSDSYPFEARFIFRATP
jgi:hypothetical protein